MSSKSIKIIALTAFSITAILITVGNGCSKRADYSSSSSSSAGNNVFESDGNESASTSNDIIPGAKTASVVYAKQALDQLTSCAGVRVASDDTNRMYNSKEGSISAYGEFSSVTAPMLVAVTNISGEVCDDLIDQEFRQDETGATARVFTGIRMANNDLRSDSSVYVSALQKLALSCWHKQATTQEINSIVELLDTVPMGSNLSNRNKSLLLCTAVLSSLKSLVN